MYAYLLDGIFALHEFLDIEWKWTARDIPNVYCKVLSKYNYMGVYDKLVQHLFMVLYHMVFEEEAPCMYHEARKAFVEIADWFGSPQGTYITVFSSQIPPHFLSKVCDQESGSPRGHLSS